MKKYIQNFKVYLSEQQINQKSGTNWLANYQVIENKDIYQRYAVRPSLITTRHLYAKGIGDIQFFGEALYSSNEVENPSMEKRGFHAQEKTEEIFQTLYKTENEIPDQINHVSCTHYQSPSAAQKLVVAKEWFSSTIVTHLYHMGCYAALPAIRVSSATIADGSNHVDVVHTELCSFHLNKENITPEQIIMNTLFADGAIKYSVTSEDYFEKKQESGLEILTKKEVLVPNSDKEMSWKVGDHGFVMTLTRKVPIMLARTIEQFMRSMFTDAGLDYNKTKEATIFAIHPGGPKIIDSVEKVLKLTSFQVKHSKHILKTRGNMSSATLPHIWNDILKDSEIPSNTYIATVAFGPGLTITGAILKLCRH